MAVPPGEPTRESRAKYWTLLAAITLALAVHLLPTPPPLSRGDQLVELSATGKTSLAILLFAVILWVTETVPVPVTALFVVLLIPVFGITDFAAVIEIGFGDPIIAFFIGVLILSAGFTRSGLGTRLTYHLLLTMGTRTDRVLLGFLAVGSMLSMWVTDMAVAAMLLPIGVGLLRDAQMRPMESRFGKALMIACAFGPLIGGIATPAGTGANPIAIRYLKELADVDVSFLQWMLVGVPAAVMMVPLAWLLLLKLFPPEVERLPIELATIRIRMASLGRLSGPELKTLVVFFATIALWLLGPLATRLTGGAVDMPIEAVALFGGLALFLPGMAVLSWKQAEHDVEWGGILLIVAGLSLGMTIYETGAARWLAWVLLGGLGSVPDVLRPFVIVVAVALLHLMFSSNTVTSTIIIPILIALASDLRFEVWDVVAPAAFTSSLAFILVTEGPTTIIPYTAGYFSIRDLAKAGIWMTLAAALCVALSVLVVRTVVGP
ncbi:MAG: DASS family sodium-coupled anion symporter [Acidobacteria bacterium]|nr:DASS family sodium-coupled anion symporter [Acidobacteriota bacterium]